VMTKLLLADPYKEHGVEIRKIECYNHLMVAARRNLEEVSAKGPREAASAKRVLTDSIPRLLKGINMAAGHWRKAMGSEELRQKNLGEDIRNCISHILGSHSNCRWVPTNLLCNCHMRYPFGLRRRLMMSFRRL